jgi:FdhD protein
MIQKAERMGATMVISRTSPTSLSVRMAERSGITLIGYARGEHFTIYSHAERILTTIIGERISDEAK